MSNRPVLKLNSALTISKGHRWELPGLKTLGSSEGSAGHSAEGLEATAGNWPAYVNAVEGIR